MPVFLHLETQRDETKQFRAGLRRLFRQVRHLCDDFLWRLLRACTRCRRSEVWSAVDWVNTGEMS